MKKNTSFYVAGVLHCPNSDELMAYKYASKKRKKAIIDYQVAALVCYLLDIKWEND